MNQYKLEAYVPDEGSMKVGAVVYADTPEEAYTHYLYLTSEKDEAGNKKYISTRLYVGAYKQMENPSNFFNIYKV